MPREQVVEYRNRLQMASDEPVVQTLLQLINLHLDLVKSKLLDARTFDEVSKLQGEAKGYIEVKKWILTPMNAQSES